MPIGRSDVARVAGAVLLTSVVGCAGSTAAETQAAGSLRGFLRSTREDRIIDRPGRAIDPAQTTDKVVALAFSTTDCSIACVGRLLDRAAVADALSAGQRSRVSIVAPTVNPARDTPDALGPFAAGLKLRDRRPLHSTLTGAVFSITSAAQLRASSIFSVLQTSRVIQRRE